MVFLPKEKSQFILFERTRLKKRGCETVSWTPVFCPVFSLRACVSVCASVLSQRRLTSVDTRLRDTAVWAGSSPSQEKRVPKCHLHIIMLYVLGCTRATLMYSTVPLDSLLDMNTRGIPFLCTCPVYRWWSWLLLWTRQDQERFYVSSAIMEVNTELCQDTEYRIWTQISRVHSPVVKAADCRSAGPWFNSGWETLFTFVTWYDKLTNHDFLMINFTSPITTSNRTITRKSVNRNNNGRRTKTVLQKRDEQMKKKVLKKMINK